MTQKIAGYRELSPDELAVIDRLKQAEAALAAELARIATDGDPDAARWLSLARTHLETGMMFAVKAVARPTGGLGRR